MFKSILARFVRIFLLDWILIIYSVP
jgi:hypothetical protein